MLRYVGFAGLAAVFLTTGTPATTAAQVKVSSVFVGGGANIPVGDFSDGFKTGWMGAAGLTVSIGDKGVFAFAEGLYGQNSSESTIAEKAKLYGGGGALGYRFGESSKPGVYVYGSAGALVIDVGASETQFSYGGGAGVDIPISPKAAIWIEGRLLATKDITMVPIMAGISISTGGD